MTAILSVCRPYRAACLALIAAFSASAYAADSPVCTTSVSQNEIDYGQVTRAALTGRETNPATVRLGTRFVTLMVNCRDPVAIGLTVTAPTSADGRARFGESGGIALKAFNGVVDGQQTRLAMLDGATPRASAESVAIRPGDNFGPVNASGSLAPTTHFSVQLEIDPQISGEATKVRSETRIDGNLRLVLTTY
ncbi:MULTISPECIES: hypothetical protein [Paraburkholderia]|uniref:hypothetical protein n=1 Tax=Paraburkholderia TaxID=1822464 RepID=UPI00225709E2|nr:MULTISPECIES: hypothetical protein [Paraburkholderia]MCX4163086.1 hypothetical protein [Paraburkholderia megapolitana]MDN7158582.1 hypothetical protein [Paraburkholderia sp. CHISQ3]MDQ6495629.1 hypothetical protein [Paraburkholderia megapolitana]